MKIVFLFASELKALKAHPEFNNMIYRDAMTLQLRHNCIPAPYSIYKNVLNCYLSLSRNEAKDLKNKLLPTANKYWSLIDKAIYGNNNQLILNDFNIQRDLEGILKNSVKKQMPRMFLWEHFYLTVVTHQQ